MNKKSFPKWFQVKDDGNVVIAWRRGTQFDHFDSIEKALRQMTHILEQYGNERIVKDGKVVVFLGNIANLRLFREVAQKTLDFLKSVTLDNTMGIKLRKQIGKSEKEIISVISAELKKNIRIYYAVMRRSLEIKKEIIVEKRILFNLYVGLVDCYDILDKFPTEYRMKQVKKRIAGRGANLINGLDQIIANPYKKRVLSNPVKRLRTINIDSIKKIQIILKLACNKIKPAIEGELEKAGYRTEIFVNSRG